MKISRLFRETAGFTLTEVLVVLSVAAVMSFVGYTGFSEWKKRDALRTAAYGLAGNLRETRLKAMEKFTSYFVDFGTTSYIIYVDVDSNDTLDTDIDTAVKRVDLSPLDRSITMAVSSGSPFRYTPQGLIYSAGGSYGNFTVSFANDQGFNIDLTNSIAGGVSINEKN